MPQMESGNEIKIGKRKLRFGFQVPRTPGNLPGHFDYDLSSLLPPTPMVQEVVRQAGPLSGTAPVGADTGYDTLNKKLYVVNSAGAWEELKTGKTDMIAQVTLTATAGTVSTTQDATRIANGVLPVASATNEGVLLEVIGTSGIIVTAGPALGVGEVNTGDFLVSENTNGTFAWKKFDNTDKVITVTDNADGTMTVNAGVGQTQQAIRPINELGIAGGTTAGDTFPMLNFGGNTHLALSFAQFKRNLLQEMAFAQFANGEAPGGNIIANKIIEGIVVPIDTYTDYNGSHISPITLPVPTYTGQRLIFSHLSTLDTTVNIANTSMTSSLLVTAAMGGAEFVAIGGKRQLETERPNSLYRATAAVTVPVAVSDYNGTIDLTLAGLQTVTLVAVTTTSGARKLTLRNQTAISKVTSINYRDVNGNLTNVIPAFSSITIQEAASNSEWRLIDSHISPAPGTVYGASRTVDSTAFTTTHTNDTVLVASLPIGSYHLKAFLIMSGAGDYRTSFSNTGTMTGLVQMTGADASIFAQQDDPSVDMRAQNMTTILTTGDNGAILQSVIYEGSVIVTVTGTISVMTSGTGAGGILRAGSHMMLTKLV